MIKLTMALALAIALFLSTGALAHKVNLFASESEGRVCAEGYTADGRPTKSSKIMVFKGGGEKILEGTTDEEGVFCFERPGVEALELKLEAGPGHLATFTLPERVASPEGEKAPPAPKIENKGDDGPSFIKIILGILIIAGLSGLYILFTKRGEGRDAS
ncbi:MAG: hypothetical protein C0608_01095 [Deltaproteobacteria bacterium]|nr:MAG: hypothetical protein C0608_01095 [Deltaproteobacteria bacterium]